KIHPAPCHPIKRSLRRAATDAADRPARPGNRVRAGRVRAVSASGAGLLPHLEALDDVADLDVVVADADTALEALADLGGVVLEAAQRRHREVVGHHHAVADEPGLGVALDDTRGDHRTGHVADPRDLEDLADLGGAELDLLVLRLEHALEGRLDLLDRLVDDRVVPDVDALAVGQLLRVALGAHVEADDDRAVG